MQFMPVARTQGIPLEQAKDMIAHGWDVKSGIAIMTPGIMVPGDDEPKTSVVALDLWHSPDDSLMPAQKLVSYIHDLLEEVEDQSQLDIMDKLCQGLFGKTLGEIDVEIAEAKRRYEEANPGGDQRN